MSSSEDGSDNETTSLRQAGKKKGLVRRQMLISSSESGSDNESGPGREEPQPRGLFSDGEDSDDDGGQGHESQAEEDGPPRSSGARGGDRNTDEEEEEERKQEERRKKEAEKKKKPKGPVRRQLISEDMLTGKNGLSKLPALFEDFKFGGKGREKDDLNRILAKLEHWIHLLHPRQPFDQSLQRIEFLGLKRKVMKTHLKKIRMGLVNHFDENDPVIDDEPDMDEDVNQFEATNNESERQEPMSSTQAGPSSSNVNSVNTNNAMNNDEFPDDDEIMETLMMAEKENADPRGRHNTGHTENDFDEEMDVDMEGAFADDDDDDFFQKELDAKMKRAAAAEALENEKEALKVSQSEPNQEHSKSLTDVNDVVEDDTVIIRSGEIASGMKSQSQMSFVNADATTKIIEDAELDGDLIEEQEQENNTNTVVKEVVIELPITSDKPGTLQSNTTAVVVGDGINDDELE